MVHPHQQDLDRTGADLALLVEAARLAGQIAAPIWERAHDVWEKDQGAGPVTEADLAVDAMLHDRLMTARPDYGWLSEETEDAPERRAARLRARRVFVVDPIDGTRAFTGGERTWAHALAVVEDGLPVVGVVYLPLRDKLYTATRGGGARLNDRAIRASATAAPADATLLAARPAMDARHWKEGAPPVNRVFRASLAYRLALVGEGRFDAMLTLRDSWEWDIAAGALIVEEAGGRVTDRSGQNLSFNTAGRKVAGVLAAPPALHAPLLERLA